MAWLTSVVFKLFMVYLVQPSVRSLVLAILVGLALTALRQRDLAVRLSVWRFLLCAGLAMPLLGVVLPNLRLDFPSRIGNALHADVPHIALFHAGARLSPTVSELPEGGARAMTAVPETKTQAATSSWAGLVVIAYAFGLCFLVTRLVVGLIMSRTLRKSLSMIQDGEVLRLATSHATKAGLRTTPGVAISKAVAVPFTFGWSQPLIVLPPSSRQWGMETRNAVLVHEISHVVRQDALLRIVAALHVCVFWFSPLSWWLEQHLALLSEEASDEAVLRTGADRTSYAAVLLGFYEEVRNVGTRIRWQRVELMAKLRGRRRIERMLIANSVGSAHMTRCARTALILAGMPILCAVASVKPSIVLAQEPAASASRHLGGVTVAAIAGSNTDALWLPFQSSGQASPRGPIQPGQLKTAPSSTPGAVENTTSQDQPFVILYGEDGIISAYSGDLKAITALRSRIRGNFIWFLRDGKPCIISDEITVAEAIGAFPPRPSAADSTDRRTAVEALDQEKTALALQVKSAEESKEIAAALQRLQSRLQTGIQVQMKELQRVDSGKNLDGAQGMISDVDGDIQETDRRLQEVQTKLQLFEEKVAARESSLSTQMRAYLMQVEPGGHDTSEEWQQAVKRVRALVNNAVAEGLVQTVSM